MKKLFILTSVFALAACAGGGGGGGSGGGGSRNTIPDIPAGMRSAIDAADVESNNYVTQMRSEVVVASNNNGASRVVRASTVPGANGYTFTSYRLDDVKLYAADAKKTDNAYLKLGLNKDTGRIENVQMVVGGASAPAARQGADSHLFRAPIFEYVEDEFKGSVAANTLPEDPGERTAALEAERASHNWSSKGYWQLEGANWKYYKLGDKAKYRKVETDGLTMADLNNIKAANTGWGAGHWNRIDEVMDIVTYGGDIDGSGTALQYADFGHFNPVYTTKDVRVTAGNEEDGWTADDHRDESAQLSDKLAKEDYQLFAGGYAIKGSGMAENRPSLDPIMGATYKGTAIGRVYTSIGGDNRDQRAANFAAYGITDTGDNNDGKDIAKLFTTREATMKITKSGGNTVQTLDMPFYSDPNVSDKFYDIKITKTGNGNPSVTFRAGENNYADNSPQNEIESQYRIYDASEHWDMENASFNPGYYGVNTGNEAAGTAEIGASYDLTNGAERDYEVQAAWGMKIQPQP